ncbi:MAG: hypothetical protein WCD79_01195 [Chthoniobacteraceae bacterium]
MNLAPLDFVMIGIPLVAVMTVALTLRRYMKSVADFLAASRCAGRYIIGTSIGQLGSSAMALVLFMESFSRTGFSIKFWEIFVSVIFFIFTLFGLVTYRFRETRCLTFHQFFEVRYSKGMRVFSSFINIFSGLINFGLQPAVGARFFVYFCGLPETFMVSGMTVPTFAVIMVVLMALSMVLALTGGQISVMVTDCAEGLISGIFYLAVAVFVLSAVTASQMKDVLLSGPPGGSYVNPFDISGRTDFNGWYIVLSLIFNLYIFRGNAWQQGFNAAAKTAHEGKMSGIISTWRNYSNVTIGALIAMGAFTLLHHPDFAHQREMVMQGLKNIGSPQLRTQMDMPMALGVLLIPGVKGAFCAIALFGLLAGQGVQLHSYGSTLLQDVILPLRKRPLSPRAHLIALQLTAMGVGIFACIFSMLYKPVDYLQLMVTLIGAIYLGGVGAVVWGGLYWKKGTTAGAWASMITGTSMAILFNVLQQFWQTLQPHFVHWAGNGKLAGFLMEHRDKCPIDGQQFSTATAICALGAYVIISLITCKEDFDMDRMLHRGKYAIKSEDDIREPVRVGFNLGRLIGIDEHYTKGDKIISVVTFLWAMAWQAAAICILLWYLCFGSLSDAWWFKYTMFTSIWIPLVIAVITTVWFTIGIARDMVDLFKTLRVIRRNDADDGTVLNHHNAGEK